MLFAIIFFAIDYALEGRFQYPEGSKCHRAHVCTDLPSSLTKAPLMYLKRCGQREAQREAARSNAGRLEKREVLIRRPSSHATDATERDNIFHAYEEKMICHVQL